MAGNDVRSLPRPAELQRHERKCENWPVFRNIDDWDSNLTFKAAPPPPWWLGLRHKLSLSATKTGFQLSSGNSESHGNITQQETSQLVQRASHDLGFWLIPFSLPDGQIG